MILKCEKQCAVYNETAKTLAETIREFVGVKRMRIALEPNSNDFSFNCDRKEKTMCKSGWVLVDKL